MEQVLGGNIVLVDFDLGGAEMIVIKKIIGNHARGLRDIENYSRLRLEMRSKKRSFEIKAEASFEGFKASSEIKGENPFIVVDGVMKGMIQEIRNKMEDQE